MDDIISKCANRNLKNMNNLTEVENDVIKRTYEFEYKKQFNQMSIKLIDLINLEKLEREFDTSKIQQLEILKNIRNSEAHTHLKGITRILDSASVTINRFDIVYEGLKDIETKLKRSKFKID